MEEREKKLGRKGEEREGDGHAPLGSVLDPPVSETVLWITNRKSEVPDRTVRLPMILLTLTYAKFFSEPLMLSSFD